MSRSHSHCSAKNLGLSCCLIAIACFSSTSMAIGIDQASEQVKIQPCKDNLNIGQILDKSIKSHSQRDIGWRAFQEGDYCDIERAVLINKGLEFHYRWRVSADGSIQPQNERTEKLCHLDPE